MLIKMYEGDRGKDGTAERRYSPAVCTGPVTVRRRAQAAREAVRSLVNQSRQLSAAADVLLREAEAALHALRDTMRRAPTLSAARSLTSASG